MAGAHQPAGNRARRAHAALRAGVSTGAGVTPTADEPRARRPAHRQLPHRLAEQASRTSDPRARCSSEASVAARQHACSLLRE
jgi:hypothetical protein